MKQMLAALVIAAEKLRSTIEEYWPLIFSVLAFFGILAAVCYLTNWKTTLWLATALVCFFALVTLAAVWDHLVKWAERERHPKK